MTVSAPSASTRRRLAVLEPYLYSAPALLLITVTTLVPIVIGISYAFRSVMLLDPTSGGFVGLDNFRDLMNDASFWNALRNTVTWTASCVAFQFVFGLILALMLNRPFPGRSIIQPIVFLPWAIPTFLIGMNWSWLLNPAIGPLPHWAYALGLMSTPGNILSDPDYALLGPVIAGIWWGMPFFAITLLAALQSIPREIYEAAEIDGASSFERFRSITLPFLAPTMVVTVMLRTIWVANSPELIVVMTKGGPADASQIVASYVFTQAYQGLNFGYASAIATALVVLLLIYALLLLSIRQMMLRAR
ncbi:MULTISPECIES: sugar ABC transporter permease [unclassified Mesorhizobium]|uniref:carbohydrate ABC transporter permease n=1 Tax=unclassified Mesorhizobium TaxID=325217 RepID=UPI00086E996E|nr:MULTISPECIES: sugar ABC transporter permease [unclassified Mesorhizobium]MBN9255033.1 sugar ABC transporter permease [Mesorhizobium sp.]ODT19684.1 MAG: ABC transporter permease [Mesorhizobium sp. SCN 65-12]OJX76063.1 MAG: ABC transporter permease [Mesorhizobium sp. 65-26]